MTFAKEDLRVRREARRLSLPIGVKCISFSYLSARELVSTIAMLSWEVRDYIGQTKVLDQQRVLNYNSNTKVEYFNSFLYSLKLCTDIHFHVQNWQTLANFQFSMIMNQFQDKLTFLEFPLLSKSKMEDEERLNKLIIRYGKCFTKNKTTV